VLELSKSEVFSSSYELFKGSKKVDRDSILKSLKQVVTEATKISTTRAYYTRIFSLARDYVDYNVFINLEVLHYETVAKVVKIIKYLKKNDTISNAELKEIKESIVSVWVDGLGAYSYNNLMDNKVHELKEEYKLKEQEDEFVFIDMYNMVEGNIGKMNNEQLLKLQELIVSNLQEVA